MKDQLINISYTIDLQPGEKISLPPGLVDTVGPGRWIVTVRPASSNGSLTRQHDAFLNSYVPEDEGQF